jgi:hypothetical protein
VRPFEAILVDLSYGQFKEEIFRLNAIKNKENPKNDTITELDICIDTRKYIL